MLPSVPDLTEHRETVERLWKQYDRERQEMKDSQARGGIVLGSEESLEILKKAFDAEHEDDVPPDPYM